MNVIIGMSLAYQSFAPSAGSSILFTIIAITLFSIISLINLILYYRRNLKFDYPYYLSLGLRGNMKRL